ncbi:hypothetical protein [Streptomyces sp. enrichment culture]|uniref:hypothetical protein n=1 Tax=Streptomyces sp. enrichment culture TaxID=1795815 RepID=UPI003F55FE2F
MQVFDAGGGAGGALDLDVAFLGAAGAAQVVGLAELLDHPALLLVVGGGEPFGVLLDGLALLEVGDAAGTAASAPGLLPARGLWRLTSSHLGDLDVPSGLDSLLRISGRWQRLDDEEQEAGLG